MHARASRLVLRTLPEPDHEEGRCGAVDETAEMAEGGYSWQRAVVPTILYQGHMKEFFTYYVKGRVFEWTMALAMFFAGLELLIWDVLSFGPPILLLEFLSQKWLGTILFFTGWIRISSLMFNGQLLFGRRVGQEIRMICAIVSAVLWAQFTVSLLAASIVTGVPSVGIPFWTMFTVSELLVAYTVGAEWRK